MILYGVTPIQNFFFVLLCHCKKQEINIGIKVITK